MKFTRHPSSLLAGHQQAVSLPRALGRQPLLFRWIAGSHIPAVPHLCALYPVSFHPSTSLLRPFGGFPGSLSLGGQRARQVRRWSHVLSFTASCVNLGEMLLLFWNITQTVVIAALKEVIHQARAMGVTTRPWPRLSRSTRTRCVPCTLPESTQPQVGVGETLWWNTLPTPAVSLYSGRQHHSGFTWWSPYLTNLSVTHMSTIVLQPLTHPQTKQAIRLRCKTVPIPQGLC